MKKYLIYLFLAFAAINFTACEDDAEPMGKNVKADLSTMNFDGQNATAQTISVLSDGDWVASAPEWITVTPNYGTGNMTVSVTVADNLDVDGSLAAERTGVITFSVMENRADVQIVQSGDPAKKPAEIQKITVAEFNAAAEDDSIFYELTGTISDVKSTYYGNFNITDETGTVYVYGLYDKAGGSYGAFESLGLSEGDLITLRGYRGSYNGLIEVMGGYYVSHVASLISATPSEIELPIEGGNFEIALAYKGETFEVAINDEAKSWLNMGAIRPDGDTTRIAFSAGNNPGGLREATISFTSVKGSVVSTVTTSVKQEGSILDASVADFLAAPESTALYRLSGKVKSIVNTTYGNFYLEDATGEVYVYGLTATQVTSNDKSFGSLGIKVGDIVTLIGTRASYNGTAQVGGPAYYESHISCTEATVAEVLAAATGDTYYKVTGTIKNVASDVYGNFDLEDETGTIYVYGLTKAPVAKNDKSYASLGLKEGDKVTLVGKRAEYKGTAQIGSAYYLSHEEGVVDGGEGEGEEGDGEGETTGTSIEWTMGSGNQSWVEDSHATYGKGFGATDKGIKVAYYKHTNNNDARTPDTDHIRVYKGSALVIASTEGKAIKKVVIEATGTNYAGSFTVGETEVTADGTTLTWTGNVTSFEAVTGAQVRIKKLTVVVE